MNTYKFQNIHNSNIEIVIKADSFLSAIDRLESIGKGVDYVDYTLLETLLPLPIQN